jgi:hypothetical protein
MKMIFDLGNAIEDQAERELKAAGFTLVGHQEYFEDKALELTGRVDFKIEEQRNLYPVEVKGLQHWDWEKINCADDMLKSSKPWIRKDPAQLLLDLYGEAGKPHAGEQGLFYIKSKLTLEPKPIWIDWEDYADYLEGILAGFKVANAHVAAGTYPEPMEYDPVFCDKCDFLTLCGQERIMGTDLEIETDENLLRLLAKRAELRVGAAEYAQADAQIKAVVRGRPKLLCGDWLVTGKPMHKEAYAVPARDEWHVKIVPLKPPAKELEVVP